MNERRPSSFDVPDQTDAPVVWDPKARTFVPVAAPPAPTKPAPPAAPVPAGAVPAGPATGRRWVVGTDAVGRALPPRPGGRGTTAGPVGPSPTQAVAAPAPPPAPTPVVAPARSHRSPGRGKRLRFVPRLRWIVAFFTLLPMLLLAGGWWWANDTFSQVQRVPVGTVLDPIGGQGTNYLIVGSDSRDAVVDANSADPNIQPGEEESIGQRSDTMLLLRVQRDGARIVSIPRDLWVTIADSGDEDRINTAFASGGAERLIRTIQQNLNVPIHRYVEVDFVTFSGLVDALGGITLGADVIPHPAFDRHSGLNIPTAGPVQFDGAGALAFVRSRFYTQIIDGQEVQDGSSDIGRGLRQQAFLRALMGKAGASRNPLTLMRVARSVTGGIRVDDRMSLIDAARFAWNMGHLDPVTVEAPVVDVRRDGKAVLEPGPGFDEAIAQFR